MLGTENLKINQIKLAIIFIIITALALTLVGAFFSAQTFAKDEVTLKDVNLVQKFLSAYKRDNGHFPSSVQGKPSDFGKYLESIPMAVNTNCGIEYEYRYELVNSGENYTLSFCLEKNQGPYKDGSNIVSSK